MPMLDRHAVDLDLGVLDAMAIRLRRVAREGLHATVDDDSAGSRRAYHGTDDADRAAFRAQVGAALNARQPFPDIRAAAGFGAANLLRDDFVTGSTARDHPNRNAVRLDQVDGLVEERLGFKPTRV